MARILLEDGTLLESRGFGASRTVMGEIVFNTGMTGYQEILTDPSYKGQIVIMTYPLIGNYGININDVESNDIKASGLIVREYCSKPNHYEMEVDIDEYLNDNNVVGICGIDTRMLTKKIRDFGTMKCLLCTDDTLTNEELKKLIKEFKVEKDLVAQVSSKEEFVPKVNDYVTKDYYDGIKKFLNDLPKDYFIKYNFDKDEMLINTNENPKIAVIDFGVKKGIIKHLLLRGCKVKVFPYNIKEKDINLEEFDAVFFSNGPGDPKDCTDGIKLAKDIAGKIPLYGICLGHQILALSQGADTYKLKFGHRGSNHPVINLKTEKVAITSQNHGYAVDFKNMPKDITVTYKNVNDDTVEGIEVERLKIKSVQFHPEEGPGPTDAIGIIYEWIDEMKARLK